MDILERVVYTLNAISVSGKDNLDMLLGCINLLESILHEQKAEKIAEKTISEIEVNANG